MLYHPKSINKYIRKAKGKCQPTGFGRQLLCASAQQHFAVVPEANRATCTKLVQGCVPNHHIYLNFSPYGIVCIKEGCSDVVTGYCQPLWGYINGVHSSLTLMENTTWVEISKAFALPARNLINCIVLKSVWMPLTGKRSP